MTLSEKGTPVAIRAESIGKRYRLGERLPYRMLGETIGRAVRRPFRRGPSEPAAERHARIWALRDISFDISEGEIIGIIGSNGSGKTTLLSILARITRPTEGRAYVYGRVGSLLEVGTGFHPELTGRENVYLNGAILGMTRTEVTRKYEEIATFAETEEFMETPVKHYSSGMRVRLAFSVAAHLEPEIMFVDEVLAVGDAAFQQKCLGKMEEVARGGRTVVFVSHNMGMINSLCSRAIWLERGSLRQDGRPAEVIESYLSEGLSMDGHWTHPQDTDCGAQIRIGAITIVGKDGRAAGSVPFEDEIRMQLDLDVRERINRVRIIVRLRDVTGNLIVASSNLDADATPCEFDVGRHRYTFSIPGALLQPKKYFVSVVARRFADKLDEHENCLSFQILPMGTGEAARRQAAAAIAPVLPWCLETIES